MKIKKFIPMVLLLLILSTNFVMADDAEDIYKDGVDSLKNGDGDSAFLQFSLLVQAYPKSARAELAQLQVIEYLNENKILDQLGIEINRYYKLFPQGENIDKVRKIEEGNKKLISTKEAVKVDTNSPQAEKSAAESTQILVAKRKQIMKDVAAGLGISEEQLLKSYNDFWK